MTRYSIFIVTANHSNSYRIFIRIFYCTPLIKVLLANSCQFRCSMCSGKHAFLDQWLRHWSCDWSTDVQRAALWFPHWCHGSLPLSVFLMCTRRKYMEIRILCLERMQVRFFVLLKIVQPTYQCMAMMKMIFTDAQYGSWSCLVGTLWRVESCIKSLGIVSIYNRFSC